jgi:hypothetical protein
LRAHDFITENDTVQFHVSTPNQIQPQVLDSLANLIAQGNEVDPVMVARNLSIAPSIGYAIDNHQAVGVVVLKDPYPSYRTKVFANAGVPEMEQRYQYELGYVYVLPEYRQYVSARLLRLMNKEMTDPMFATTRENNTTINTILKYARFQPTGEPFPSDRGGYNIILWTKN